MSTVIRRVDTEVEKRIVEGSIYSDRFLKEFRLFYKKQYMKIKAYRLICEWSLDYFRAYKSSPKKHIIDIYHTKTDLLEESLSESLQEILEEIVEEPDNINVEYLLTQTRDYYRSRSLEIMFSKGYDYVKAGKIEEAENIFRDQIMVSQSTSKTFNPFDDREIITYEHETDGLLTLNGRLGDLVGELERGWLVSFLAPMKRGKTFWLTELAFIALEQRLKVLFISFEMNKKMMKKRIYKRLTGALDFEAQILIPVFDCFNNQDGSCKDSTCDKFLIYDEEKEEGDIIYKILPKFEDAPDDYKVCNTCRDTDPKRYISSIWKKQVKANELKLSLIKKKGGTFKKYFGDNLRIRTFPSYSASMDDVIKAVEELESYEEFTPDVIITDYADIILPERGLSERGGLDSVWKAHKKLATLKDALVITASQSNRKSISKKKLDQVDIAEDIRKIAHVDLMLSLNQLPIEKEHGVMRLNVIAHRHKHFDSSTYLTCLQQLDIGLPLMDSDYLDLGYN